MSKMYKCDRCGKMYDGVYRAYGTEEFYTGSVNRYWYPDEPRIDKLDLCGRCQGILDKSVRKFMDEVDEAERA